MTLWENEMYCVLCDKIGELTHAFAVFEGESLCKPHLDEKRLLRDSGDNGLRYLAAS